jgi:hypothetical protein
MSESKDKKDIVNNTIRLDKDFDRQLKAVLASEGRKLQWLVKNFLVWYAKNRVIPWAERGQP